MHSGFTQVQVHQQCLLFIAGETAGQLQSGKGLTFARNGAGDCQYLVLPGQHGEIKAGADIAESLIDGVLARTEQQLLFRGFEKRDIAKYRQAVSEHRVDFFDAGDLVIDRGQDKSQQCCYPQPQAQGIAEDIAGIGKKRQCRLDRRADDEDRRCIRGRGSIGYFNLIDAVDQGFVGTIKRITSRLSHLVVTSHPIQVHELIAQTLNLRGNHLSLLFGPGVAQFQSVDAQIHFTLLSGLEQIADLMMGLHGGMTFVVLRQQTGKAGLMREIQHLDGAQATVRVAALRNQIGHQAGGTGPVFPDGLQGGGQFHLLQFGLSGGIGQGVDLGDDG